MTVMPFTTPRSVSISRCSLVWGMTPSSAAMTSMTASMPAAPATICLMNFSWPGTSMMLMVFPEGRSSGANPSSIVMPLFFSSASRSQSTPDSALTTAVFPWSMCPAVPKTNGYSLSVNVISPCFVNGKEFRESFQDPLFVPF